MTKNKIIFNIDRDYKQMFRMIITDALKNYSGVPLEWEDIYYPFLSTVPSLYNKYHKKEDNTVSFTTFIGLKCKNFTRNYSRKYMADKYKVLNNAYSPKNGVDTSFSLKDSVQITEETFDIGELSPNEMLVYKKYFLEGMRLHTIVSTTKLNIYYATKAKNRILTLARIKYGEK